MKRSRMRQSLVRGVGLLVMLSLLVSACGAPAAAPAAPAEEAPAEEAAAPSAEITPANTLVYGTNMTDLITLDPGVAYEFSGILVVGNIYETLALV